MGEPSCSNERGQHRSAALVRRGGPPGVEEQGKAVMGSPGKLGEPPVSSTGSRSGSHRHEQDPGPRARFPLAAAKKEKAIGVIGAERNAKAERRAEAVLASS